MSIDEIQIDSDEDGFRLILTGDFEEVCRRYLATDGATLSLRLPQDAALQLAGHVRKSVAPWADGYELELAAYTRATPAERIRVLHGGSGEHDHDPFEEQTDRMREAGDLARKSAHESGGPR